MAVTRRNAYYTGPKTAEEPTPAFVEMDGVEDLGSLSEVTNMDVWRRRRVVLGGKWSREVEQEGY